MSRGVIAIGKPHFPEMNCKSRAKALKPQTIKAAWAKAGLYPCNPDRVLRTIPKPPAQDSSSRPEADSPQQEGMPLRTPGTFDEVISMRRFIEQKFHTLDPNTRYCVKKLAKSTERVSTARDILFQENEELIKQNSANSAISTRTLKKSIVVGKAKVMSYEDVEKEVQRREEKEAAKGSRRGRKGKKAEAPGERQQSLEEEIKSANHKFERAE